MEAAREIMKTLSSFMTLIPLYILTMVASGTTALAGLLTLAMPTLTRIRDWTRVAVDAILIVGCAIALHGIWGTTAQRSLPHYLPQSPFSPSAVY